MNKLSFLLVFVLVLSTFGCVSSKRTRQIETLKTTPFYSLMGSYIQCAEDHFTALKQKPAPKFETPEGKGFWYAAASCSACMSELNEFRSFVVDKTDQEQGAEYTTYLEQATVNSIMRRAMEEQAQSK